jgi:hypothetical protein
VAEADTAAVVAVVPTVVVEAADFTAAGAGAADFTAAVAAVA